MSPRPLRFEARRLALETLAQNHLEHDSGSRSLIISHARVMPALSLAAVAGFVPTAAAMLRSDRSREDIVPDPRAAGTALTAASLLVPFPWAGGWVQPACR